MGGVYNNDDGSCYTLSALQQICIMVDLSYAGNLSPQEAELVSDVKVVAGCYADGAAGQYQ